MLTANDIEALRAFQSGDLDRPPLRAARLAAPACPLPAASAAAFGPSIAALTLLRDLWALRRRWTLAAFELGCAALDADPRRIRTGPFT